MSYEKQDFTDNTVLTASQLNHMERGIVAVEQLAGKTLTIGTVTTGDKAAASIENGKLNLTLPRGEPPGRRAKKAKRVKKAPQAHRVCRAKLAPRVLSEPPAPRATLARDLRTRPRGSS